MNKKLSEIIKKAKRDPKHRKLMSQISTNLWKDPEFREKQKASRKPPSNKIDDKDKEVKVCPHCKIEFLVVPSRKNRKFCSKICFDAYRIGRKMENWNPNSLVECGYKKCLRGYYLKEDLTFRSSYELAAIHQLIESSRKVEVEPFFIWYEFRGAEKRYFPDLLIDDRIVVEIKPRKLLNEEKNRNKFEAIEKYCKENNLIFEIWTEDEINLLDKDKINELVERNIVFISKNGEGIIPCNQKKELF